MHVAVRAAVEAHRQARVVQQGWMAVALASLDFMLSSDVSKHGISGLVTRIVKRAVRLLGVHLLFKLALI